MSDFWNGVLDFLETPLGGIGGKIIAKLVRGNSSSSAEGVDPDSQEYYEADSPKDYGLGEYLEGLLPLKVLRTRLIVVLIVLKLPPIVNFSMMKRSCNVTGMSQ